MILSFSIPPGNPTFPHIPSPDNMQAFTTPFTDVFSARTRTRQHPLLCTLSPNSVANTKLPNPNPPFPPIVFVLGGPGSGKGTQCAKLKRDFNFEQVCVGDLLRREAARETPVGKRVAEIMQRGEIVPGDVTMKLLKAELSALASVCRGVLIDGFPRAMDQAEAFENMVATCWFVLYFRCEEKEMVYRLLKRGKTSGRSDDVVEVVKKRLRTFLEKTMPVIKHYRKRGLLREVDAGHGSPAEVYAQTKMVFDVAFAQ